MGVGGDGGAGDGGAGDGGGGGGGPNGSDGVGVGGGAVKWLFSESEGQWCECFLSAAPAGVAAKIAAALLREAARLREGAW